MRVSLIQAVTGVTSRRGIDGSSKAARVGVHDPMSCPRLADDHVRRMALVVHELAMISSAVLHRRRRRAPVTWRAIAAVAGKYPDGQATISDWSTLATAGEPRNGRFHGGLAYVNSKLCNMWFTYELDRRIAAAGLAPAGELTVNAFDPGLVPGSALARHYPPALRFVWNRLLPALARPFTGVVAGVSTAPRSGAALAQLVLDPALANLSGKYFPSHERWRPTPSSEASYYRERARALWEESVRLTRLSPRESPLVES